MPWFSWVTCQLVAAMCINGCVTVVSFTTTLREGEVTQTPPLSAKLSATMPAVCSMTRRCPCESKAIPRGLFNPLATSRASYPGATEGAATEAEMVVGHDDAVPDVV